MLLGLHIVRDLGGVNQSYIHYAIYSMSGSIGFTIMAAALFNIYSINYMKSEFTLTPSPYQLTASSGRMHMWKVTCTCVSTGHPTSGDLGVTSEPPADFPELKAGEDIDDDDDEEPQV